MKFYDRDEELGRLAKIDEAVVRGHSRFTVVTGRRRVGKTEIVRQHMSRLGERALYFFVGRRHVSLLREEFARVASPLLPGLAGAEHRRLADLVKALLVASHNQPTFVAFDEFQNFAHVDPGFFSDLQAVWDELHNYSRCHLLVCGSTFSLMRRVLEDRKEPLYGRATDKLRVEPLPPSIVRDILADHGRDEDLLAFSAVFGGIPRYYELVDNHSLWDARLDEILATLVFDRSGILYGEGQDLLLEEFGREHHTYFAVLSAIARGNTQLSRIADATGMPVTSVSKYVDELQRRYGLVERRTPVLEEASRKGLYRLCDPFLTFWFRYVNRNASFLEVRATAEVTAQVKEDLDNFLGPSFETLCREVLLERTRRGERPLAVSAEYLGSWWDRRSHDVDIVLGNSKEAVLLECKLSAARFSKGGLTGFLDSAAAFAARHPELSLRLGAVSHGRTTTAQRQACARSGVALMDFDDLWSSVDAP